MNKLQFKTLNIAKFTALVIAFAGILGVSSFAAEETAENSTGFEVAAKSDRSDRGFQSSKVDLTMVLANKNGKKAKRELTLTTFEIADEKTGDKTLVQFNAPRDINGTALLSHAKILDADDQWLFLPSIKRVKRISSANKSGPFVGSEFSFEDMTGQELNKYEYSMTGVAVCGELTCDLVERIPLYEGSAYSKQVVSIDQTDYQIRKIDFYDRKGDLLKSLNYTDYRKYKNSFWRAHKMAMTNHQTGKSTDLIFKNYSFGLELSDSDFTKGRLARLN